MDAMVTAYIVHHVPGRLRLKLQDRRGDTAYFAHISECLGLCRGVSSVHSNARTGSVILAYLPAIDMQDIKDYARDSAGLDIQSPLANPRHSIADAAGLGLSTLDKGLSGISAGIVDVRSVLFLALIALLVRQVRQGHIAGPVSSLLLSAFDMTGAIKK